MCGCLCACMCASCLLRCAADSISGLVDVLKKELSTTGRCAVNSD